MVGNKWCTRPLVGWSVALTIVAVSQSLVHVQFGSNGSFSWQVVMAVFAWTYVAMVATGLVYHNVFIKCWGEQRNENESNTDSLAVSLLSTAAQEQVEEEAGPQDASLEPTATTPEESGPNSPADEALRNPSSRLHYLDNLRIFLVGVVVTGHAVSMAMYLFWTTQTKTVDLGPGAKVLWMLMGLWVPIVMPLFFAISGYVTPPSFRRAGSIQGFLRGKRHRLWWPAMVVAFTLGPMEFIWEETFWLHSSRPIYQLYFPNPEHAWFLFTLLVFQWMYCTFQGRGGDPSSLEPSANQDADPQTPNEDEQIQNGDEEEVTRLANETTGATITRIPFPSFWKRFLYGFVIAGMFKSLGDIFVVLNGLNLQDWPRHLVLFWGGIVAYENQWLETQVLANHLPAIRVCVAMELVLLVLGMLVTLFAAAGVWQDLGGLLYMWVSGAASIDMSILLIHCFQTYANRPWHQFWKRSAYSVYLIHKFILMVIVVTTANVVMETPAKNPSHPVFLANPFFMANAHHLLTETEPLMSQSDLTSDDYHFTPHQRWFGVLVVLVATHLISWPAAWGLMHLPGFRHVLG